MECKGSLLVYPSLRDTYPTSLLNANLLKNRSLYKTEGRKTVLHEMVKKCLWP